MATSATVVAGPLVATGDGVRINRAEIELVDARFEIQHPVGCGASRAVARIKHQHDVAFAVAGAEVEHVVLAAAVQRVRAVAAIKAV